MPEEKKSSTYRGYTEAQARAHKKYMEQYVEIRVRATPEKRDQIRDFAVSHGETISSFINKAIDEKMERDGIESSKA